MLPKPLEQKTLAWLQELLELDFAGRDELYAVADSLENEDCREICRRLAEFLAGHAAELQQIVVGSGNDPAGPLDLDEIAHALIEGIKSHRGNSGVLGVAETVEREVRQEYDRAIRSTDDRDAEGMLQRQRQEIEFAERVLRTIKGVAEPPKDGKRD